MTILKITLAAVGAMALAATSASAAIVCNDDGDCWHVKGEARYKPELRLHIRQLEVCREGALPLA